MNNPNWTKWIPIDNLAKKYETIDLTFSYDGLKIYAKSLKDDQDCIRINFPETPLIFRSINIEYCKTTLKDIDLQHGNNYHEQWTFFRVRKSDYINWLHEESLGAIETNENHFAFVFSNCIIDVIEHYEPKIEAVD